MSNETREYVRLAAEGLATVYLLPAEAESIIACNPGVFEETRMQLTSEEVEALNESCARVHAQQEWRRMAEQKKRLAQ